MFEKIKIAQAQESGSEAINNLEASDQKMLELNNSLLGLLDQYQELNFAQNSKPFFSFDNIYFWVLLLGLLLLAFALGSLLRELKKSKIDTSGQKKIENKPAPVFSSGPKKEESLPKTKENPAPKSSAVKKPIKIKVLKVKK